MITANLIDLFASALAVEASVIIHERRTPGARAALYAWAAVANVDVTSIRLGNGRYTAHRVCRGLGDIQVVSLTDTSATVGAPS